MFGTSAATLQRRRRHRALPAPARPARRARAAGRRGPAARASTRQDVVRPTPRSSRRSGCATWPRSPRPCAATTPTTEAQAVAPRGGASTCARRATLVAAGGRRRGARRAARRRPSRRCPTGGRAALLDAWPAGRRGLLRRRAGRYGPRPGAAHAAAPGDAVGQRRSRGWRCPAYDRRRRAAALPARENLPGPVPVHRRGVPVQARGRGPGAHVRRRGRRVPHQPALPAAVRATRRRRGCRPRSTR